MCAIAGWIVRTAQAPSRDTLQAMLQRLAHRGPDGTGHRLWQCVTSDHVVALGHRRLAIIDPAGPEQPMWDAAAGLALTFNGEIYNFRELREELIAAGHQFSRDSDTEVLLHAYAHWGRGVVHHLRGMFAFAIWDAHAERLFLARDRFGEKPLFLYEDASGVYFASEIKALLRVDSLRVDVDLQAVWDYLAYRYVPAPRTLFSGIYKLMPGSYAIWERGQLTERCYWRPADREAAACDARPREPVSQFLAHLDEAVRLQMISDVPFGAFLSGGLDSSTIVALMSRHHRAVRTFSVGFDEAGYSELEHAQAVARQFGTQHNETVVSARDLMEGLAPLVKCRDAPVSEPSDIALHLLARQAAHSVKMVLTGEGSDELLGGYPKHVVERLDPGLGWLPPTLRRHLLQPLARALPYGFRRLKTAAASLDTDDWRERYVRWFGALNFAERERLSVLRRNGCSPMPAPPFDADPRASALRRVLYFDQTSWLPDNLLERADRMAMAASIETRVPFLDHKLAAFVSSLPDRYRVRGLTGKWILRQAARRLLPARILTRPKVGFRVPVNLWLRGPMREYLLDHLCGTTSRTRAYYDPGMLDRVLDDHLQGTHNHEKLLWSLLGLELWHRQYV